MRRYRKIKYSYQRVLKFVLTDIWRLDLTELSIMRARMVRYLKVLIITFRGFNTDNVGLQAVNLSFFSALAVVPFVALMFTITKGFGLAEKLETLLLTYFSDNEEIIEYILQFANNVIKSGQNGFFGAISFVFLLWTVIWLMLCIERSFNDIWKVVDSRSFGKRTLYYILLLLVSPLIVLIFMSLGLIYSDALKSVGLQIDRFIPITSIFTWLTFYLLVSFVFTLMYYFIPYIKVKFSAAFNSSLIVSFAFVVTQFFYLETQLLVSGLNAVYGVFAAIPLFLVWMNISWTMILFGAELSHAYQNVDNYNIQNVTLKN